MHIHRQAQILDYAARDMLKNIENHIKANYVTFIQRFVNVFMNKRETLANLHTAEEKRAFNNLLRQTKQAILNRDMANPLLDPFHHLLHHIIPVHPLQPNNVIYDLKRNPMDYFERMLNIMRYVESRGETLNQVLPLRTSIIPSYICLDTVALIKLLGAPVGIGLTQTQLLKNVQAYQQEVWSRYFNTDARIFMQNNARFHYMIMTDGLGSSILFDSVVHDIDINQKEGLFDGMVLDVDDDLIEDDDGFMDIDEDAPEGDPVMLEPRRVRDVIDLASSDDEDDDYAPSEATMEQDDLAEEYEELYIDQVNLNRIRGKRIVAIDPGKEDLLYCVSITGQDANGRDIFDKFRYTHQQRRFETRKIKYEEIRKSLAQRMVGDQSVNSWQSLLSEHNSKTTNFELFQDYIFAKNMVNFRLYGHYSSLVYRQLKWNSFIHTKRSEDKMLNNFTRIFGPPTDTIIGIGDWAQAHQLRNHEPTKGKGFRKLFRKAGYQVYLVDEHRSSLGCYNCCHPEARCEKFRYKINPRPHPLPENVPYWVLKHGLLKCDGCNTIWNRNVNGALNIYRLIMAILHGEERPLYLQH